MYYLQILIRLVVSVGWRGVFHDRVVWLSCVRLPKILLLLGDAKNNFVLPNLDTSFHFELRKA